MFSNMKVGSKLALGFGAMALFILLIASFSLLRITQIDDVISSQNEIRVQQLERLYTAREALGQTGLAARNAYIFTDDVDANRELDILDAQKAVYLEELNKVAPLLKGDAQFDKVYANLQIMAKELERPRQFRNANQMEAFGTFLVTECSPLRRQIVSDINTLVATIQKNVDVKAAETEQATMQSILVVSIAAAIALVFSALLGWIISRAITRPLHRAVEVAQTVANGDLTSNIQVHSQDETGQLLQALKDMNASLIGIVDQVRDGTGAIASASNQIASGNLDLSTRTEQQASSLEETASSMEELTSTVRQNADNAREANNLSINASSIAVKGGEVVNQVVATMNDINASAQRITDIISVIDGIAFQTNILALNAAVEAARAGEEGRGFAVVAAEVRSLAHRSATAAKEIKSLIDDSVSKVDIGSKLVQEAGSTMTEVVDSVKRVTTIMADIMAASQEQSSGIEQINEAIAQMDHVTQQNAALVEEAAAAAASLQSQASRLEETVGVFQIDGVTTITRKTAPAQQEVPAVSSQRAGLASRLSSLKKNVLAAPSLPAIAAPGID
ncbi:methyl-accepting chemotaxis protein [Oxalicibacterium faecigallinarum]|uniref:Methyl-accepting chemotaxis protein n=1 Tax=Oxalicibacterium faecigallinarum TaxID=573741 RepID=A0A8J3ANU8_9BURK|nr:methyl-accepting chemotaxis protein [Oxalicibacterium faecigallinarum]GGI18162.1 methyl-accepting chemotaxis protein [Oxalicibacterium faecigallinarum]